MSAILIQLSADQHVEIKAAAQREGLSLKRWCLAALVEAAGAGEELEALTTCQMIRQIHKRFCIGDLAPQAPATEGSTAIDALVQMGWVRGKAQGRVARVVEANKGLLAAEIIQEAMKHETQG